MVAVSTDIIHEQNFTADIQVKVVEGADRIIRVNIDGVCALRVRMAQGCQFEYKPPVQGTMLLSATTAVGARREISRRWPDKDVEYKGYDLKGECVLMSLVRKQGDKAHVATVTKNRSNKPVRFEAEVP